MEVKGDLFGAPLTFQSEADENNFATGEYQRLSAAPAAPIDGALDYLAPPAGPGEAPLAPGDYVAAPLGGREAIAVVWGPGGDAPAKAKLKTIARRLDLPPMTEADRRFLERAAAYTMTPLGEMVRLATRAPKLDEPAPTRAALRRGGATEPPATQSRRKALERFEALAGGRGDFSIAPKTLAERAEVGAGVLKALVESGHLAETAVPKDPSYGRFDPDPARGRRERPLSDAQSAAAEQLTGLLQTAPSAWPCSTASPVRVRPRFIWRRWRNACARGGRR